MMNKCPYCNKLNFNNCVKNRINEFRCKGCNNIYCSKLNKIKFAIFSILFCSLFFIEKATTNQLSTSILSTYITFTLISYFSYFFSEEYSKIE